MSSRRRNRRAPMTLPHRETGSDVSSLPAGFAAAFPLRRPSPLATTDMAGYPLTRSEGTIGEVDQLFTDAAVAAVTSGEEAVKQRAPLLAPWAGPSELRRLFEREPT